MALADLRDELNCSICKELYIDPVMLPCGHNYCQGCIIKTWESEESRGEVFACPDCRRCYMRRPEITRNMTLRNIVDKLRLNQKESGIFCTYCVHSSVPASKTCLLCEASLCVTHLCWHSKSEKHVLTEPTTIFESKKCSIHGKSCHLDGEHRGHKVQKLNEASEKRKECLRKVLEELTHLRMHIEEREQRLEGCKRQVKWKSEDQTKEVTFLFKDIMKRHEALEKRVSHEISQLEEKLSRPFTDQLLQLKIKKQNMIERIHHIEELCNMVNPIAVIEEWNSEGSALTEEGDNEGSRSEEIQGPDLEQMDQVSKTLLTGLNGIVSDISRFIYEQKTPVVDIKKAGDDVDLSEGPKTPCCSGKAQQTMSSCTKKSKKQTVFRRVSCFEAPCCVVPPMYMERATDITLDINTAANNVVVSDDNKTLSYSESSQRYPESSDRFQQSQVLSNRVFASGQHYWEVEVSELGEVRIGVAYPSIARKGFQSYIGENTKSWCLYRYETSNKLEEKQQKFSGRYYSKNVNLPYKVSCSRLGVYLDCEAGSVSFYEICDQIRHLHTFTATFTEPLHAAFCVWGDASVTILS
ncbi:hypothetical protein XELAEV_18046832mg [Xenopus laevis]|uniref:Uncharacterized protein n=1 Tax=Xenopus laevis TaxID=8355 RepID=A0A974BUJ5_XENLA|nr:hypothetical protein XELAEV_18046832mg [Xenopus laevis]